MSFWENEKLIRGIGFEKAVIEVLQRENPFLVTNNLNKYDYYLGYMDNEDLNIVNRFRHGAYNFNAFISNRLNLSCFYMDSVFSKHIYIKIISSRRMSNYLIEELLHLDTEISNDFNACIVLIILGKISEDYRDKLMRRSYCKWIFIERDNLLKNHIIKKVIENFDDYIIENDNVLIKNYYKDVNKLDDNYSFALGAGCSINSNISDWNRLSEALGYELLYNVVDINDSAYKNMHITNELNKTIFNCYEKNSALDAIYTSYISSPSVTKYDYYDTIRKVLYMSYDSPNDANKDLMTSINNCIKRKNMREIITYNFDSVLEQNYDNLYKSNSKEVEDAKTIIGNCVVYHVHGYIPYDYNGKSNVNSFIFTDGEYYKNMINHDSQCNIIQSRILENYNVIFVGVSFVDTNMKERLRERKIKGCTNKIFAFMKLPEFNGKGTEIKLMESKYKLIQQNYFDTLGVKILWVHDFKEIPEQIDKI